VAIVKEFSFEITPARGEEYQKAVADIASIITQSWKVNPPGYDLASMNHNLGAKFYFQSPSLYYARTKTIPFAEIHDPEYDHDWGDVTAQFRFHYDAKQLGDMCVPAYELLRIIRSHFIIHPETLSLNLIPMTTDPFKRFWVRDAIETRLAQPYPENQWLKDLAWNYDHVAGFVSHIMSSSQPVTPLQYGLE
jgi:hypothetical protein